MRGREKAHAENAEPDTKVGDGVFYSYISDMAIFGSKNTISITVEGMTCEHCEMKVRTALSNVEGVKKVVKVDHNDSVAVVSTKSGSDVSTDALVQAVSDAGYTASAQ